MKDFKVSYDQETDVLYIAREGEEAAVIEISPGINLEMDGDGKVIGVEILNASKLLRSVIDQIAEKSRLSGQRG